MRNQVTMSVHPFILLNEDMSEEGQVYIGQVEVTFTPPKTDPVDAGLDSINNEMRKVREEFQGKLIALQERKDNLLARIGSRSVTKGTSYDN